RTRPCCVLTAVAEGRSHGQAFDLGGADAVVQRDAAGIVRGKSDATAVVADGQIRVVIFAMGYVGERIHERHRLVVIGEGEGFLDAVLDELPPRERSEM